MKELCGLITSIGVAEDWWQTPVVEGTENLPAAVVVGTVAAVDAEVIPPRHAG